MSECSGATASGVVILEEPEVSGAPGGRREAQAQGPLRCGGCALWPRQQTWLCVVPLLIGFIGLGLSLMLLKWIVVGTVRDYVPTDLVDAKGIGQDPFSLSNPSDPPNNHQPDTTTTTTTTAGNPTSSTAMVGRGRTRATSTAARGGGASGTQVMPRNPPSRQGDAGGRGGGGGGGGGGGARGPVVTTTTTSAPGGTSTMGSSTSSPLPSNPTVLHDSTQMWTHEHTPTQRAVTTLAGRTHGHRKTPAPTVPPLRSEHFKPCHERDLAYCLNDGECFVIETLSGPHKHCRCREGYQGIRCDQFLPKTDSIVSDPTDYLGIEFMESKEVYKRQVLSITSIAVGISLLGMLCMALYCRNKRRREKLQAHLKETRSLKNYSASRTALEPKTSLRPSPGLQLQNYCKRGPQPLEHAESSFAQFNPKTPSNNSKGPSAGKHHRSVSLSHSLDQRSRATHWTVPRRTPPIPRSRLNPMGVSKNSGPAYQHLQEMESSDRDVGSQIGCQGVRAGSDPRHDTFLHMQPSAEVERSAGWGSRVEVHIQEVTSSSTRSLRGPRRLSRSSPPPFRSCSIPIIPSVQAQQDEVSCMQTASGDPASFADCEARPRIDGGEDFALISHDISNATSCSYTIGQRDEVALLLEEAQEQLRALAHANRKHDDRKEDCNPVLEAREIVCFLTPYGAGAGGFSSNGPTETQLLSPQKPHRDTAQNGQ